MYVLYECVFVPLRWVTINIQVFSAVLCYFWLECLVGFDNWHTPVSRSLCIPICSLFSFPLLFFFFVVQRHSFSWHPLLMLSFLVCLCFSLQGQASTLERQQDTVEHRLEEMKDRLSKSRAAQKAVCQEESPSQTTEQTHSDSQSMSKHTIKPADKQGVVTQQFPSTKQHSKHMDEAAVERDMMA